MNRVREDMSLFFVLNERAVTFTRHLQRAKSKSGSFIGNQCKNLIVFN